MWITGLLYNSFYAGKPAVRYVFCQNFSVMLRSYLSYAFPAFPYTSVISSSVVRLKSPGMLFLMADAVRAKLMSFGLSSPNFSRA